MVYSRTKRKTCVLGATDYYGVLNDDDKKCYPNREFAEETCKKIPDDHFIFSKKMQNCILRKNRIIREKINRW